MPPTLNAIPLREWTVDRVCQWLSSQELSTHIASFRLQGVDGRSILGLSFADLSEELGIPAHQRRHLWDAIQLLKEHDLRIHNPHMVQHLNRSPRSDSTRSYVTNNTHALVETYPTRPMTPTSTSYYMYTSQNRNDPLMAAVLSKESLQDQLFSNPNHQMEIELLDQQLGLGNSTSRCGTPTIRSRSNSFQNRPPSVEDQIAEIRREMVSLKRLTDEVDLGRRSPTRSPTISPRAERMSGGSVRAASPLRVVTKEGQIYSNPYATNTLVQKYSMTSYYDKKLPESRSLDLLESSIAGEMLDSAYYNRPISPSAPQGIYTPRRIGSFKRTTLDDALDKVITSYDERSRTVGKVNYRELLREQAKEVGPLPTISPRRLRN
eukprot:NODE_4103_length_1229_cov_43.554250_g3607_i0.p1 GENE.NODE_4103_length_1229_cov_43.554250_g3607_i0~~NODE_4103_length_1229_cov_43.554250_g3607_i0.p1  ORF type:complete len:378 (+),score=67.72 NODE_4103_length_1229_cov_43.554250_g3607_i0:36-1169(+)